MRIFGSPRISKPSAFRAYRATPATSATNVASCSERQSERDSKSVEQVQAPLASLGALEQAGETELAIVESTRPGVARGLANEDGDSDVFVCRRSSPDHRDYSEEAAAAAKAAAEGVTLFVYGWESVEPGPLSWAFPSLRAALDAVKTMRNAVEWCIVAGSEWVSVDAARAKGAVLIEQNA